MPNYQNGKIYAIRSHQTTNIYIGSTTRPLSQRLGKHRISYNDNTGITSKHILQYPDYYIELLETYPCNSKDELEKKEGEYIRQFKDICVNVKYPNRTPAEYRQDHKDQIKEYYQQHKEYKKEYSKEYHQQHKEEIKEQKKEYYQDHIEEKKIYSKEYYQQHKEELNQKVKEYKQQHKEELNQKYNCECGGKYIHSTKARHLKTTKHKNYLANM